MASGVDATFEMGATGAADTGEGAANSGELGAEELS